MRRGLVTGTMPPRLRLFLLMDVDSGMIIISHRGLWLDVQEKNTPLAFARSFSRGFGTETDLRDRQGELVIAHDPAGPENLSADEFFQLLAGVDPGLPLALNIKADGLQKLVVDLLSRYGITNAFVFDMSIPDTLAWLRTEVRVFTRQSEYEPVPALLCDAAGVWLDAFERDWWTEGDVQVHLDAGKQVAIVSPELHGRDPAPVWRALSRAAFKHSDQVMLCTDLPFDAHEVIHA